MNGAAEEHKDIRTKWKNWMKGLSEWRQRNAKRIWKICAIAILLALVLENIWLLFRKRSPLGPEQGGSSSLQRIPTIKDQATQSALSALKQRLAQDETTNAELQSELKAVAEKLVYSQAQLERAREAALNRRRIISGEYAALEKAYGVADSRNASAGIRSVPTSEQGRQSAMDLMKERLVQDEKTNMELQSELKAAAEKLKWSEAELEAAREVAAAGSNENASLERAAMDTTAHSELATKAQADDVKTVDTKVTGVKTDLDASKNDLKMARSEMGTLIARNHDDIDQLRRLGERDYIEFTITRKGEPQKLGDILVELKSTNEKKNQFSIVITLENKRFEKENRHINEPIFYYTSGNTRPQELVINKIEADKISGYLSVPKNK